MSDTPAPTTPPGTRLYAIGDIHGRMDLLKNLMEQIAEDAARHPKATKELIFLGDYIDRGLHSYEVIHYLLHHVPEGIAPVYLRGNHEDILLRIYDGDKDLISGWLHFGGAATLASYGIEVTDDPHNLREALRKNIPQEHLNFLRSMPLSCLRGDYYFVHAGVRPGVGIEAQSDNDKLWIRETFLSSTENFGKMIVHGHSIHLQPEILPNRIGIDTGAYATGRLTCLILDGNKREFLHT